MTTTYNKLNLQQLEQHYYLYYLQKYHTQLMDKLSNNDLVNNYNNEYSRDFVKRRYRTRLLNTLINSNQVKEMKQNHQSYLKSKK